tara:strand:+ start:252 stop:2681 length:2430 start_codon:yes stop_codon:yes gene_type:complete
MIKKISNSIHLSNVFFVVFLFLILSNSLFNKANATPTFVSETSISSQESSPNAIAFNNDGTKMFIAGQGSGGRIHEYALSTAFDTSTLSHDSSFATATNTNEELYPEGLAFNDDGTKMYIVGTRYSKVVEYNLTTGFDISTASLSQVMADSSNIHGPTGIAFNNDGSKMFISSTTRDKIAEYNLTTDYDISSASYVRGYSITNPTDVEFNNDGTKMFITDSSNKRILVHNLSSAFDVSNVSLAGSLSVSDQENTPKGMSFNADGTKMFVVGSDGDDVNEYTLSTAYTLLDSTAPTLSSSSPADNATDVAVDSNIVLNFSESVDVESGNISIKKTSDDSVIETIDVTSSNVTGTGTSQITINPSNDLDKGIEFYVLIDASAFDDSAGNSYAGITSTTALSFTTTYSDPTLDKDITGIINTQTILVNESVNHSIETINNRLSFLRQNRYSNQLSTNNISLQFNDPALSTLVSAVSAQKKQKKEYSNSEWSYWTEGTFSFGSIGENNNSSLIELESNGVAFGIDKNVDRQKLYGVSFQYLQTDSDIGTSGSSVDMKNYNITLYGTRPYNNNFVEGLLGIGLIETDIIRKKNSSSYVNSRNGSQLFGSFSLGREIETKTLNLIPTGTLSLGITELNSYSETGSSALKFDKQNIEYSSGSLGIAFENLKKYSSRSFKPFGSIKYNFDFSKKSNSKMSYLSNSSNIYDYEIKGTTDQSFTSVVGFNYLFLNNINMTTKYKFVEGNKSKRSQQINFALTKIKNDTDYSLAFDSSDKQLLKFNILKKLLGFNLGLGSDLSLKENNYNSAEIFIAKNF